MRQLNNSSSHIHRSDHLFGNIAIMTVMYELPSYPILGTGIFASYCYFISVEQLKCRHLVLNSWHHFSVVLH